MRAGMFMVVLREMVHRLSVVESGEGSDASIALCGAGGCGCWGL